MCTSKKKQVEKNDETLERSLEHCVFVGWVRKGEDEIIPFIFC